MIYAKVKGSVLDKYPYDFGTLQQENPFTNYGEDQDFVSIFPQTEQGQNGFHLEEVKMISQPDAPFEKKCMEGAPQLVGDEWIQTWVLEDIPAEELEKHKNAKTNEVKSNACRILAETDWVELPSVSDVSSNPRLLNKDEFMAYRSTIRSIAVNPSFDSVLPQKPAAVWSK